MQHATISQARVAGMQRTVRPVRPHVARGTSTRARGAAAPRRLTVTATADAWSRRALLTSTGVLAGASLWMPSPPNALALENPSTLSNGFQRYFGQATSASSYGGYGGNEQDQDVESYKYWFDVPGDWKAEIVTKQEKGYQGIDARFSQPDRKSTNAYVITFAGYNKLKSDYEEIISDLALADSKLQDAINLADSFNVTERVAEDGQVFVDYDIVAEPYSTLCSVTTYNKRLYAILAWSTAGDYEGNKAAMNTIRNSLQMVKKSAEDIERDLALLRRGAINCTMGEC